jgi:DNA-binding NarL/FixJ family response regulator
MSEPVRVLLADDEVLLRSTLRLLIDSTAGMSVVGEAASGREAVQLTTEHAPDVVLMDVRMPRVDGLAATERLRARRDPPEVIVLTTFDTDGHIRRAMRAGASGFLLKHTPPAQIAYAVRQVAAGEPMLSPDVIRRVMAFAAEPDPDPRRERAGRLLDRLSDGERAVALLVGQGRTNSEIGQELRMSTATVKAYMSRILTKLDLNNRVQVALVVHDAGLSGP